MDRPVCYNVVDSTFNLHLGFTGEAKNFGIFYQLNLKQSITYQYLKHNYTSDRIICPDEDNLSVEDPANDQTSIMLWTIE